VELAAVQPFDAAGRGGHRERGPSRLTWVPA
jgi:hypothetical protein